MPTRAKHHDFEPSEQFGLRYSATGKLVKISDPEARGKEAITYTNCLDIFDLAEALDIELTEEQAQEEAERIYENRKQFYNNHSYMKKKAIGEAYDGPVFNGDSLCRRSNGEKYTVRPDGSLESKAGKIIKEPNFEGFVHTFPRKHERTATFKEGRPRKDAPPVLTLPKQDNPLIQGECKTRTPEEASRSAAKQREQARKEAAKTTEAEKDCETCPSRGNTHSYIKGYEDAKKELCTEAEKQIVREHYLGEITDKDLFEELRRRDTEPLNCFTNEELYEEINRRGLIIHLTLERASNLELTEECKKRGIFHDLADLSDLELAKEMESRDGLFHRLIPAALRGTTDQELAAEIRRRNLYLTTLDGIIDKQVADELRRRGYTVTATKTVEI